MGYALYQAQIGKTPRQAKPLKGFGSGAVIELRVRDARSNAYRTVYAANLNAAIYVLHAFKKKSTKGIETAKRDIDMIHRRLRDARDIDRAIAAGKGERRCAGKLPKHEVSSGNVFADAGLPDAELHLLKAEIVNRIDDVLKERPD